MTRSLVVAPALPLPAHSGNLLRWWQNVVALSSVGPVGVFGLRADEPARPPRDGIEVWASASDPSLTDHARLNSLDWLRDPVAVPWDEYYSTGALAELENVIERFRPDVVVVEEMKLYRYVEPLTGRGWRVVIDASAIESELSRGLAARSTRAAAVVRNALAERSEAIEAATYRSVDQVWVCSQADAESVRTRLGDAESIVLVPNTIDVDEYRRDQPYRARSTMMFPAMFAFKPNETAALFLAREVVPRLAKRFDALRLVLVGQNPTPAMLDAAERDPRIFVTGTVPDVRPYLAESGAMPIPLFDGSGTRLKALEAFAAGVPVVSTSKGVEGLDAEPGTHFLRAEDGDEFVAALTRLWSAPAAASKLVGRARSLVEERYSWDVARRAVGQAVERLGLARAR
ncbi:MAG TPA: glycosyltransferase family 4 protein [Acidimicrobiia bacterium]|nr:glycosyltransferase family 4 protein [Acidimicrobiia bacterium]